MALIDLGKYYRVLRTVATIRPQGRVSQVIGLVIEAEGISAQLGELCLISPEPGLDPLPAEVVGFKNGTTLLMPLGDLHGIRPGSTVQAMGATLLVPVGESLLGRVLDGLGRPMDDMGPVGGERTNLNGAAPHPLTRAPISEPLPTGVRVVDGLLTCGKGQRMGIFAGSGVGKSTLLGMIAQYATSDVNVIALIGERGREVQEFIQKDLGPQGLARSIVVVSTSDAPALVRVKAAWLATAIAEHFRDRGRHVVFLMDSITRLAMAQREIGLAIGEPPATRGYTPSVFGLLARLIERAGTSDRGTITAFYTVLVEGDDLMDPVADTVRSILDGHIVLSRELASENHYPAIDVLTSVSRVMHLVTDEAHREAAGRLRELLATYARAKDLVNIGAYVKGSDPRVDLALELLPDIRDFLRQKPGECSDFQATVHRLQQLVRDVGPSRNPPPSLAGAAGLEG